MVSFIYGIELFATSIIREFVAYVKWERGEFEVIGKME
jgi:hypothetical protein